MKTVSLLQLGDIHYPDHRQESGIDAKDPAFPRGLQELTQLKPLQLVMRSISQIASDGILICGDITTRGDVAQYDACLSYLFQNLNLGARDSKSVHVVPGNHDVERAKVDQQGSDLYKKFESFSQLWDKRGLPVLTVKEPRVTTLGHNGVSAFVVSLNSSLGCGEEYYPLEIRDGMKKLLRDFENKNPAGNGFSITGQKLDTPLIAVEDVTCACEKIQGTDKNVVPVVLAHHNLLPQALPRIAIYTELINGGLIRSRLCGLERTVLYCHGHIHQSPIEILEDPRSEKSKLVSIAAPELAHGFNLITLHFSSKNIPLGCVVRCYRLDGTNASVNSETFRIPLQSVTNRSKHRSSKLNEILTLVPSAGIRLADLTKKLNRAKLTIARPALAEMLLEAEWLGFLLIDDRDELPEYWQIRSFGS